MKEEKNERNRERKNEEKRKNESEGDIIDLRHGIEQVLLLPVQRWNCMLLPIGRKVDTRTLTLT